MFQNISKNILAFMTCIVMIYVFVGSVSAAGYEDLSPGTYNIDAALSCHVNAMGGVEFGKPLLKSVKVTVDENKNCTMTLTLGKSSVTIYDVTCDTFVDTNPSRVSEERGVKSGTVGIYNQDGSLVTEGVKVGMSKDTALNAQNEAVHYVETITFPVNFVSGEYRLTLFINSNVMGVQFCEKSDKSTAATYPAILSVKWNTVKPAGTASNSKISPQNNTSKNDSPAQNDSVSGPKNENVVEEEGLNIHYTDSSVPDTMENRYFAYVDKRVFLIICASALVLVFAGVILLISSRKNKKESNTEGDTKK